MATESKERAFEELFNLIIFYSENRDRPTESNFNFFEKVDHYCQILDLNQDEIKRMFGLKQLF